MKPTTLKACLMASTLIGGLSFAAPAMAQDSDDGETITVTGSRIARQDFVANSPVATVDSAQFEMTGTINTESLLNTLPQTVPGLDRTSNNPGNGTATVDLRGLGSGRTLVLVNGTRAMPGGTGGTVDINSIPSALIERVEVVTGGASAVYGSDAVAGVVNFILKDDFEGVEFNLGYEQTQRGDGRFQTGNVTMGGNFDNGRGNAVVSMGYVNREEVFQGDRDFARVAFGGDQNNLIPLGSSGVPAGHFFSFAGAMDWTQAGLYFPGACPEGLTDTGTACMGDAMFDTNGNPVPWINGGPNNTRYNYAPVNYLQLPQERYNATAMATYDLTDDITMYTRVMFSQNQVDQQLAPTPAFTFIDVNIDNPFLGPDSVALLTPNADVNGIVSAFLGRRMVEVGPRRSNDTRTVFQFQAGLRGSLNSNMDWDVYFQSGRSMGSASIEGDVSQPRLAQALLTTDGVNCFDSSNGCVPINVFGEGNISQAAADFVSTRLNSENERNQQVFSASINGDTSGWLELPGGPIGFATGFEYRTEDADFRPSQDLAAGTLLGFNGAPPVGGHFDVYDYYGEALLPILSGVPMAEVLEVELAARYSDYSTSGGADAYKVAARWAPIEDITFRASFNTAVRAPNISELFSPPSNGFPGYADPCAGGTLGSYTASARLDTLCAATGVPAAAIGTDFQPNGQVEAIVGGNSSLGVETAETFTVGVILEPSAIDGLQISVDYFDIELTDAVSAPSAQYIINQCYDSPNTDPNSEWCSRIVRFSGGAPIQNIFANLGNIAGARTSGVDVQFSWDMGDVMPEFIPGDWRVGLLGTRWEENSSQATATAASEDCIGIYSGSCGEPNPEWTHRATVDWMNGAFNSQLVWRYIGDSISEDGEDVLDSENYFDWSGSYELSETYSITAGVDNVFDTTPPILGDNQEQANTWPATYDVFGRTFWLNVKGRF